MNSNLSTKVVPPPDAFFRGYAEWSRYQEDHPGEIQVENFTFGEGHLSTSSYHFFRGICFKNCIFSSDSSITGGQIDSEITFLDCEFQRSFSLNVANCGRESRVTFSDCKLLGQVSLQATQLAQLILDSDIDDKLLINNNTSYPDVDYIGGKKKKRRIKGPVQLSGRYGTLDLSWFQFDSPVNIERDVSIHVSKFHDCEFNGEFVASGATFVTSLDFSRSAFHKKISMRDTVFQGPVNLFGTTLHADADLSATSLLDMRELLLDVARVKGILDLSNRNMTRRTSMSGTTFREVPMFHGTSLFSDTVFLDAEFPKIADLGFRLDANYAENAYRALRFASKGIEAHGDEQRFFSLEMRARRATEGTAHMRYLYWFYELLSNYGQSVYRPIFGFLAVLAISFFGFGIIQAAITHKDAEYCKCTVVFDGNAALDLLGFSAAQALPFVPVFKEASKSEFANVTRKMPLAQLAVFFWSTLTAISSLLMLFLAGLGLRNQFRLK